MRNRRLSIIGIGIGISTLVAGSVAIAANSATTSSPPVCTSSASPTIDASGNYTIDVGAHCTGALDVPTNTVTNTATTTVTATATVTQTVGAPPTDTALPARGTFIYPWYPEAWTQGSFNPGTHYNPTLGFYTSTSVFSQQIAGMNYGHFNFALSSWWGQGSKEDLRLQNLLNASHGTSVKIAPYYEAEGNTIASESGSPNPTSAQITSDLNYISLNYASDSNYMFIGGKPVIFAFADSGDGCTMADRWAAANAAANRQFYIVLKVFSGYGTCANQPNNWHQYGPAVAEDSQGSHSFSISPGFWKYDSGTPLLGRDTARWHSNVTDMNCSSADLKLVTTFNEWGEGTSVESADQWSSSSGQGTYLDELHNNTTCAQPSPSPTPTVSSTPPVSSSPPPPPVGHKVLVIPEENKPYTVLSSMPHLNSYATTYGQATNYFAIRHPSLPNYLAIWGGDTFGTTSDCGVGSTGCIPTPPSIWGQTLAANKTAKAYSESMNTNCQAASSTNYVARHSPWPYWTDATERAACNANNVPSGSTTSGNFLNDVNTGNLPVTGELTPNLCNDAHDCTPTVADNWLNSWLPIIMAGPDYGSGNLTIIVVFDEDDNSASNHVAFVAIDPRLHSVQVTGTFNHYALARWMEDNAGVSRLRNAATAGDLRGAFGL